MTKSKVYKVAVPIIVFLILVAPFVVAGQEKPNLGLVTCDNSAGNVCDFKALMAMINKVIQFMLFDLVVPIAAVMFFYAGFQMITAGEQSAEAKTKAKEIFTNTVYGFVIAIAAWLIIRTILSILGFNGEWIGFPKL